MQITTLSGLSFQSFRNNVPTSQDHATVNNLIKVINQQNSGVSATRNSGIAVSLGEILGFMDPDVELVLIKSKDSYFCV